MYIACSSLCFAREPLARALRIVSELHFSKIDIAIQEDGPHLKPSEVAKDISGAAQEIRIGPSLTPAAFHVDIKAADPTIYKAQLQAICRLARLSAVSTITISASANTTSWQLEVERLKPLVQIAQQEGIYLLVSTLTGTLTEIPENAAKLCKAVPGLGLTLDPSHFLIGPHQGQQYDCVIPYVRHVHLRDTGRTPGQFQVRIGQGLIEYGRIISQLERVGYNRLLSVSLRDIPDAPYAMDAEVRKLKFLLESLI